MTRQSSLHGFFGKAGAAFAALAIAGCASSPKDGRVAETGDEDAPPSGRAYVESEFAGRTASEIDALLGTPALSRREGEGEFRRYDFVRCAFILVLYPDEAGVVRVNDLYAGAKSTGGDAPDLEHCLAGGRPL